jgi:hypothetical protein
MTNYKKLPLLYKRARLYSQAPYSYYVFVQQTKTGVFFMLDPSVFTDPSTLEIIQSVKNVIDIVRSVKSAALNKKNLNLEKALLENKIELTTVLMDAINALLFRDNMILNLQEEKREIKEKLKQMTEWNAEKQIYKLENLGRHAIVYIPKEEIALKQPSHYLCATCYNNQKKSFLQSFYNGNQNVLKCYCCNTIINFTV